MGRLPRTAGVLSPRAGLALWADLTRRWTRVVGSGASAWRAESERLLASAADGVGRGLAGLRLQTECAGRPLRGTVASLYLPAPGAEGAGLVLADADWDGLRFEHLALRAADVAVSLSGNVVLTLDGVQAHGRVSIPALVDWADPQIPGWTLGVAADGRLQACATGRRLQATLEPVLQDGVLLAELRRLSWRGWSVPVPHRLRIARRVPLPPLQKGFAVARLQRTGTHLDFVLLLPPVSMPFWRLAPVA